MSEMQRNDSDEPPEAIRSCHADSIGWFAWAERSTANRGVAMPTHEMHDPKHWYDRAEEMRALSEAVVNDDTKSRMLRLADDYDKLADRATTHAVNEHPLSK
jgi:hypothetical protein